MAFYFLLIFLLFTLAECMFPNNPNEIQSEDPGMKLHKLFLSNGNLKLFGANENFLDYPPKSGLPIIEMEANTYPLSKGQLARGISVYEMNLRMACADNHAIGPQMSSTSNNNNINVSFANEFCAAWKAQLAVWKESYEERVETIKDDEATKSCASCRPKIIRHYYMQTLAENVNKPRREILEEALVDAANTKNRAKKAFTGDVDSSDLIEMLVTLTQREKADIVANNKHIKDFVKYCENMAENSEVQKNFGYATMLKALCKDQRNIAFHEDLNRQLEINEDDILGVAEFLKEVDNRYKITVVKEILPKKSYEYLRLLNESEEENGQKMQLFNVAKGNLINSSRAKDQKKIHLWKLMKGFFAEIEFGRSFFLADILREKLERISRNRDDRDAFNDITRILLVRGPIDLADINEEYANTVDYRSNNPVRIGCTLYDHLAEVKQQQNFEQIGVNAAHAMNSFMQIVKWTVEKHNTMFNHNDMPNIGYSLKSKDPCNAHLLKLKGAQQKDAPLQLEYHLKDQQT